MPVGILLDTKTFPETLPIFPLSSVLLLPGGELPLNIFEPRYLNLVQDALATRQRLMGIVMYREEAQRQLPRQEVYQIGCAGRITAFTEKADGRYLITLTGICRFHMEEEIPTIRKYRRIKPDWSAFHDDVIVNANVPFDRKRFLIALHSYSQAMDLQFDPDYLSKIPNFSLITFFAMNLPFSALDRQALLEAPTLEARAEILITLLEMETRSLDEAPKIH
ncbi:MAG: LON peptidase substrate-binding domain-containing protein [Hyphomicrobiales bacterium]|nr:LON peptidase substrate-binding domain-containing protein [Rickettsiales bacterium]MCP5361421.1 LON peptidase substrate-binding domain-containing protein [Hyphomicrobiales bacterium]